MSQSACHLIGKGYQHQSRFRKNSKTTTDVFSHTVRGGRLKTNLFVQRLMLSTLISALCFVSTLPTHAHAAFTILSSDQDHAQTIEPDEVFGKHTPSYEESYIDYDALGALPDGENTDAVDSANEGIKTIKSDDKRGGASYLFRSRRGAGGYLFRARRGQGSYLFRSRRGIGGGYLFRSRKSDDNIPNEDYDVDDDGYVENREPRSYLFRTKKSSEDDYVGERTTRGSYLFRTRKMFPSTASVPVRNGRSKYFFRTRKSQDIPMGPRSLKSKSYLFRTRKAAIAPRGGSYLFRT